MIYTDQLVSPRWLQMSWWQIGTRLPECTTLHWQWLKASQELCYKNVYHFTTFNSLWFSDIICHWRCWSTLDQIMACCLITPSHCWQQAITSANVDLHDQWDPLPFSPWGCLRWHSRKISISMLHVKFTHSNSQQHLPEKAMRWGDRQPIWMHSIFPISQMLQR